MDYEKFKAEDFKNAWADNIKVRLFLFSKWLLEEKTSLSVLQLLQKFSLLR
jgi:hypothetical protein